MLDLLPVPEIQYLAFLHNAEDQLRGEAATLPFLSRGELDNPMVVRIAGMPDPEGPGGPFHNDGSLAVLRDVPGLVVAVPARADDAAQLASAAWRLALEARRVVVLVEPTALYHERDLYAPGDGEWLESITGSHAVWGQPRVYSPDGADLAIATYGLGVRRSLQAARCLRDEHHVHARVLDLRWVSPLPTAAVLDHARETGHLLVVDDARPTGSVSESLAAAVLDADAPCRYARITAADSPVPLGPAAALVLPSVDEVITEALRLIHR
jgi:2-oxoisovalerate dehydrogenase E1 component